MVIVNMTFVLYFALRHIYFLSLKIHNKFKDKEEEEEEDDEEDDEEEDEGPVDHE